MGTAEREERSRRIREALESADEWRSAATVGLFAPMRTEPDLEPLWGAVGKRLCFPRVTGAEMEFHVVDRPGELVWSGSVREPDAAIHPFVGGASLDLLLVPGLAFSRDGVRLGRGGGFYDRFLGALPARVPTVGVAFAFQIADAIPAEGHDIRVGRVIWG